MRIALSILCALAAFVPAPAGAEVMFSRESGVPRAVQDFAGRAIEVHCDHQPYERAQRSFWAYRARIERTGGATVYSIRIVSDVGWRKTDPPAFIEMTLVDEGGIRLAALGASFIRCSR